MTFKLLSLRKLEAEADSKVESVTSDVSLRTTETHPSFQEVVVA